MIFLCEAFAPNQKRKSSQFSSFVRNETFFFTFAAKNGNNLGGEKPPWDECNQALLLPQFTTEAIFWKYTRPILNVNFFRFWAPLKKTRSNKKAVALLLLFIEKEKDHLLTLLSFHTEEERRRSHSFTYKTVPERKTQKKPEVQGSCHRNWSRKNVWNPAGNQTRDRSLHMRVGYP